MEGLFLFIALLRRTKYNPGAASGFCETSSPEGDQCGVGSNILFEPRLSPLSLPLQPYRHRIQCQ